MNFGNPAMSTDEYSALRSSMAEEFEELLGVILMHASRVSSEPILLHEHQGWISRALHGPISLRTTRGVRLGKYARPLLTRDSLDGRMLIAREVMSRHHKDPVYALYTPERYLVLYILDEGHAHMQLAERRFRALCRSAATLLPEDNELRIKVENAYSEEELYMRY